MTNAHRCPACWTWKNSTDHKIQAQLFGALLDTYCAKTDLFAGVFFMGWPQDVDASLTQTEEAGYEFAGKNAEDVMRLYFHPSKLNCDKEKFDMCTQRITGRLWY